MPASCKEPFKEQLAPNLATSTQFKQYSFSPFCWNSGMVTWSRREWWCLGIDCGVMIFQFPLQENHRRLRKARFPCAGRKTLSWAVVTHSVWISAWSLKILCILIIEQVSKTKERHLAEVKIMKLNELGKECVSSASTGCCYYCSTAHPLMGFPLVCFACLSPLCLTVHCTGCIYMCCTM